MPGKRTLERARKDRREGKSASTQAGGFVREEIHHIREGRHGTRSAKQAIAIGLSKALHAGVELESPEKGKTSKTVRRRAERDLAAATRKRKQRRRGAVHARPSAHSSARAKPRVRAWRWRVRRVRRRASVARLTAAPRRARRRARKGRPSALPRRARPLARVRQNADRAEAIMRIAQSTCR